MQQAIATVIADVGLVISQGTIRVKQGDSKARAVNIVLRSNGSRYTLDNGVTVKLHGKPTADTDVLIDCAVIGTDTVQAVLTPAMMAVVGTTDYEAQIYGSDGERLSTAKITVEVIASNDISGVTASDDFSTLTNMISQFGNVQELTVRSEAACTGAENAEAEATRQAGLAQGYAADANASKETAIAQATKATNEADRALNNILNGVDTHNQNVESHPHLVSEVSRVESIAKGRNFAVVFDTEADMIGWLEVPDNVKTLEVGTNLYIKALDVPDYWWDGTTYQQLEVEHPDLSQYVTKTELSMSLPLPIEISDYEALVNSGAVQTGRIYYRVPDGELS